MISATLTTVLALFLALVAVPAFAAEAGRVVTLEGTVEIGRGAAFTRAEVGSVVETGDTIRTGTPGRARILFTDESVLNLGDATTLVVDESVFNPNAGTATTLLRLVGGKVRALVSDYYSGGAGTYQVETPTAVSGVRGTEFVMAYDAGRQLTEVLGLGGEVAVHGTIDRRRNGVLIHANEITEVAKGKYPTPPRQINENDERYQRLMYGLDLPGSGFPESMLLDDPAFGGEEIPEPDTADGTVFGTPRGQTGTGLIPGNEPLSDLPPQEPGRTGGDLLNQPLPVLEAPTDIEIHF